MSEKTVLYMARTTRYFDFARSLTESLGVEVAAATPDSPTATGDFDLTQTACATTASSRWRSGLTSAGASRCS